jgi:hypothetical protein
MKRFFTLFLALLAGSAAAQTDDLMQLLDADSTAQGNRPVTATFKSTRLVTGHSIETVKGKHLDFLIMHRFDRVNKGLSEFFGLDFATIRLSLEYGITDRLMVGVGRTSLEKTADFFAKGRLLRQSRTVPLSVTAFGSWAIDTRRPIAGFLEFGNPTDRYVYTGQLLLARKFSDRLSLQVAPTLVHRNRVTYAFEEGTLGALGLGGRLKLNKRVSLNAEYFLVSGLGSEPERVNYNPLAIGFDIETGGHVFQLHFTNSFGMIEKHFIGQTGGTTGGRWQNGDIHWGFNISRTFNLGPRGDTVIR